MSVNNSRFLPNRVSGWFRLPEIVAGLFGVASVSEVTAPDATDLASAQALANENKAKINEIIAALQQANILE